MRRGTRVFWRPKQHATENGLYKLDKDLKVELAANQPANNNEVIFVRGGTYAKSTFIFTSPTTYGGPNYLELDRRHSPFQRQQRGGLPSEIEQQLDDDFVPILARIYGFSFEGTYYDLPRPVLFLVHGEGFDFTDVRQGTKIFRDLARAPAEPSTSGIGAADFDFSDNIRVWSYDKADYTIRMDVETGMFEQVLLDIFFSGGGPGMSGAARIRRAGKRRAGFGARVSGARLSGGWSD